VVFLATFVTLILKEWGTDYFESAPLLEDCNCTQCVEDQIVLRMSFGMFLFFVALALLVLLSPDCVAFEVYYGWWGPKLGSAGALCAISFFIPNSFFGEFAYFSAVASGLFILLQVIVLLDWAYTWNEVWRGDEAPEKATGWRIGLLVFSLLLLIGGITLDGFMFYWFDCAFGYSMTALSMVTMLALTVLSITTVVAHGSLVASAVIFFNVQLITLTGLYNHSEQSCNKLSSSGSSTQVIFSLLLAALSITKAAWSSIGSRDASGAIAKQPSAPAAEESHVALCSCWGEAMPDVGAWRYLCILAVSMCYMGMLLSDWGVSLSNDCRADDTKSDIGMWVNLCTGWLVMLLYFWSLIAPLLFPDRDFGPSQPNGSKTAKAATEFQF